MPWSAEEETMGRKILLGCGILPSLHLGANMLGARRWRDYGLASHTVSELSAIGAPSRRLVVPLLTMHGALVIPFGLGVWQSAGRKRPLRLTAALLVGLGASDLPAPVFPMHRREALARGGRSRTDTIHIILTSVNSLLILLAIASASTAFGKRFRLYSIGTVPEGRPHALPGRASPRARVSFAVACPASCARVDPPSLQPGTVGMPRGAGAASAAGWCPAGHDRARPLLDPARRQGPGARAPDPRARRTLAANGRLTVAAKVRTRHPAFPALVSHRRLALIAR
jgi:Protein of unknown function (DUF998)